MLCQLNISNRFKSLNFDERKKKISFIIYHYTETSNLIEAVNLLTDKKRKVSSHFLIDTDGTKSIELGAIGVPETYLVNKNKVLTYR